MSVTFAPAPVHTGRIHIKGWAFDSFDAEPEVLATFTSFEAFTAHLAALAGPAEPTHATAPWSATHDWCVVAEDILDDAPSLNVSNTNAVDLLVALCLPVDSLCGSEDAGAFRDMVLRAIALHDGGDAIAPSTWRGEGGATIIDCGRREGYILEKLQALLKVADSAAEFGVPVQWS